ncbi:MAG TPA: nucleotidyltransferase family protein [Pyrinomonadaceae bacterium]|nr:nucleotidyltransferase family protein [Pyrinomonadaceae bacterium]
MRSRVEHEILFAVARREPRMEVRDLLRRPVDWEYLFATAGYHGLIPLLHKHLHSIAADLTPIHVLSRLKLQSVSNVQNVLHLAGKQLKIHALFHDNRIPIAIFKGSVLSQMAYGEISLRQAGDIDVLISRTDFHRARQLLESLGYQMMPTLTETQLNSHLASHCEIQFVRDDWFTVVDLHWALAPKNFVFKLETGDVMSRLQRVPLAGTEIETFCTEDLILYLSMHGAKHLWRAVEWISSLGELLRASKSIEWEKVIQRAANAHATRMLALGLRLVEHVSDVKIPAEVLRAVDTGESMKRSANHLVPQIFTSWGAPVSTETNLYNLKIMDRKRDVIVSALRAIFVPTISDWSTLQLPPSLHSLYYAYRPLRLSKIYTASLWRKLNAKGAACW